MVARHGSGGHSSNLEAGLSLLCGVSRERGRGGEDYPWG